MMKLWDFIYPLRFYQMNVAAAVVGGAVVGGVMSSQASKSASNAQSKAAAASDATQRYMYDQTRKDNEPFRQGGLLANTALLNNLGLSGSTTTPGYGSLMKSFGADDLANDPIYNNTINFALDQGTQGINRQAAATGSNLSGATLKALSRFGANTAATYGNDAYNRFNTNQTNTYNRLAGISGAGQQATNQVSSAGQNMANQISSNQTALGNARGASAIAGANSFNNALSTGINGYQNQQYLNSLGNSGNGYIPSSSYYANNDLLAP